MVTETVKRLLPTTLSKQWTEEDGTYCVLTLTVLAESEPYGLHFKIREERSEDDVEEEEATILIPRSLMFQFRDLVNETLGLATGQYYVHDPRE